MNNLIPTVLAAMLLPPLAAAEVATHAQPIHMLPRDAEMIETVQQILAMIGLKNEVTVVVEPGAAGCAWLTRGPQSYRR